MGRGVNQEMCCVLSDSPCLVDWSPGGGILTLAPWKEEVGRNRNSEIIGALSVIDQVVDDIVVLGTDGDSPIRRLEAKAGLGHSTLKSEGLLRNTVRVDGQHEGHDCQTECCQRIEVDLIPREPLLHRR